MSPVGETMRTSPSAKCGYALIVAMFVRVKCCWFVVVVLVWKEGEGGHLFIHRLVDNNGEWW